MARRKRVAGGSVRPETNEARSIDVADLGRQVGTFETNNGLAHGLIGSAVVVAALLILRPIARGLRAFLRG